MPVSDQGVSQNRYLTIPRTLIFLFNKGKILLLLGSSSKRLWPNKYNGVGGHVERGEDIYTAALRELVEETGLIPSSLWLCGTIFVDTGGSRGISLFVFKGKTIDYETLISSEGQAEWFPVDAINGLPLVEDLYTLIPKVIDCKPSDNPFAGLYHYDENDHLVINFYRQPI